VTAIVIVQMTQTILTLGLTLQGLMLMPINYL
jgi:hypothetical protein